MTKIYLAEIDALLDQQVLRSGAYINADGTWYEAAGHIAYDVTKAYTVTGSVRRSATANGDMYMGLTFFDAAGATIGQSWVAAAGVTPGTAWAIYTGTVAAGAAPAGTATMAPTVVLNHATGTLGYHECQSLRVAVSTTPTVALNVDEFFRSPFEWRQVQATTAVFARLFDGTPYATTLRFGTAGYMTWPTDAPANTFYDGRVLQPALMRQEMPTDYAGAATISYGELVLSNGDSALSGLLYAGLDGAQVRLLVGEDDAAYSTFSLIFSAVADQAVFDDKRLVVRLRDSLSQLDRPLLQGEFLGNNALPNGLEGGPELKGLPKPKLFGRVLNLPPPCVNTARLIYLVSDGGLALPGSTGGGVTAVYDRGVALTYSGSYVSQVDMETNAPAAGEFRYWAAGGMFRLGSTPVGQVTCDAESDSAGGGNYPAVVLRGIARYAGVAFADNDWPGESVPYFKPDNWTAGPRRVGLWVNNGRTALEALNELAKGCGYLFAWTDLYGLRGGTRRLLGLMFPQPYGYRADPFTGHVHYPQESILSVRPVVANEDAAGVPVWRVQLGWAPVMQIQEFDVDAGVSVDRKTFLANERRQVTVSDAAIKVKHPNAVTLQLTTQFLDEAGAVQEATRQLQMRRYRRAWFEVVAVLGGALDEIGMPSSVLCGRLGGYVRLAHPQLQVRTQDGVATSDAFYNVMAIELDHKRGTVRMTVRQATEPTI